MLRRSLTLTLVFSLFLTLFSTAVNPQPASAATVYDQLTEPEVGWKRVNDNHPGISYSSGFSYGSIYTGAHQSDYHYTNNPARQITFSFTGTKLRVIGRIYPITSYAYTTQAELVVDGAVVSEYSYNGSSKFQTILAEATGLSNGVHTATIRVKAGATGGLNLDALDIDENGSIIVGGGQLLEPDPGWTRYDNTDPSWTYTGSWRSDNPYVNASAYLGGYHLTTYSVAGANGSKASIIFNGTGVRFLAGKWSTMSNSIDIYLDGVFQTNISLYTSSNVSSTNFQLVVFEATGLEPGSHTLELVNRTTSYLMVDAIDVFDDGSEDTENPPTTPPITGNVSLQKGANTVSSEVRVMNYAPSRDVPIPSLLPYYYGSYASSPN